MCTSKTQFRNQQFRAPTGTRFLIIGYTNHGGWTLRLPEPCKCCQLTGLVHEVGWNEVLIDGPVPAPPSKAALEAAFLTGGEEARAAMERAWSRPNRYFDPDD